MGRLREGGARCGATLVATLDAMVHQGHVDGDYEVALDAVLGVHPFVMSPTDGLPWVEI